MRKQRAGAEATSARLDESEQRFQLLVQGVTDYAIFMLDPDGIVTSWNTGAERIKGYSTEEILGQHFSRFYTDEDRAKGLPRQALRPRRGKAGARCEGWRVRKDGTAVLGQRRHRPDPRRFRRR